MTAQFWKYTPDPDLPEIHEVFYVLPEDVGEVMQLKQDTGMSDAVFGRIPDPQGNCVTIWRNHTLEREKSNASFQ